MSHAEAGLAPAVTPDPRAEPQSLGAQFAAWLAAFSPDGMSDTAALWARHCLLDWCAVTVAGSTEPLSLILAGEFGRAEGACTLPATGLRAAPVDAALVNGAMSHALDFDDVNAHMHGHPSVAVIPAVLAAAEASGAPGPLVLAGIVAGHEIAGALGVMMGDEHYDHGFHATATVGSVAAAAGAGVVLGLNALQMEHALSLAGTQAAGLKSMFGTMAKPLHAGKAASNGLLAARLAKAGFEGRLGGLDCPQGFGPTLSPAFRPTDFAPDPAHMEVQNNLFKYHAACYLTHSVIESTKALVAENGLAPGDIASLTIHIPAASCKVCDIQSPETGLDVKFSIRHLAAMAVLGRDTADLGTYTEATAADREVWAFRDKVGLEGHPSVAGQRHAASVEMTTVDGLALRYATNVGIPLTDTALQERKLTAKARAICTGVLGGEATEAMIDAALGLDGAADVSALMTSMAGRAR